MNTPFPLIRQHKYQEYATDNTWQFYLYNNRGRVLIPYSCHKSCYKQGRANFWAKVADLYTVLAQEKASKAKVAQITNDRRKEARAVRVATLEADLQALFSEIEQEQQELHDYIGTLGNSDFLGKIERVSLAV